MFSAPPVQKVSVVIPVYNEQESLPELIRRTQVMSLLSLSFLTGSRKGIDVEMEDEEGSGSRQKTSFVGISKRDEFVDAIERVCREKHVRAAILRQ